MKKSLKENPSTSKSKGSVKAPESKPTKSSKTKGSKEADHSYAEPSTSAVKSPESKSNKSSKSKKASSNTDHSYAEKHDFDKVKVHKATKPSC